MDPSNKRRRDGVKWAEGSDDPNFDNYDYFARPAHEETAVQSRLRQVETVESKKRATAQKQARRRQSRQKKVQRAHPEVCAATFASLLARCPWAADKFADGLQRYPRDAAILHQHISFNSKTWLGWLVFDIDHPDAVHAHERGRLPSPNIIIINAENGHAHVAYRLRIPVWKNALQSFAFYEDVRRGLRRRLDADPSYHGPTAKNPLHPKWLSLWARSAPYSLDELNLHLAFEDKRPDGPIEMSQADSEGRNTAIFRLLRHEVFKIARRNRGKALTNALSATAMAANSAFDRPLSTKEINSIVRSVARWVSKQYSDLRFSRIQSLRAQSRWKTHVSVGKTRPWEKSGQSRSTWYRQRRRDK